MNHFIESFSVGQEVFDLVSEMKCIVVDIEVKIKATQSKRYVVERYIVEYSDGGRKIRKVDQLKEIQKPIQNIDNIDDFLIDCLLINTEVPLEVRINTIKEMKNGMEGVDLDYGND